VLQNAAAAEDTPLEEMVRAEARAELQRSLERLKPVDRDTLVAFYIRGRSLKQMSREFETPVGTIKRRLHVARNRLKVQLEKVRDAGAKRAARRKNRRRENRELACV
jgi:RNA polymerase sigma-70 factor (ECF subfamily)